MTGFDPPVQGDPRIRITWVIVIRDFIPCDLAEASDGEIGQI
jgi:hypothetical protein